MHTWINAQDGVLRGSVLRLDVSPKRERKNDAVEGVCRCSDGTGPEVSRLNSASQQSSQLSWDLQTHASGRLHTRFVTVRDPKQKFISFTWRLGSGSTDRTKHPSFFPQAIRWSTWRRLA
jgi:hypothetical protein